MGHKQYFEGLYIYDKYDWEQNYPVIKIDFTGGQLSSKEFIENKIKETLRDNCRNYNISFEDEIKNLDNGTMLKRLVVALFQKFNQPIVLLIDEYDKPIIDNISNAKNDIALEAREILRGFYSAIKACDEFLRFIFITGVSKFSKLNLFSGLNNIEDITIDKRYATITGYTHNDLKTSFEDYLRDVDLEKVKKWYNGNNYFGEPIYNPFNILLFFSKEEVFDNYWWETGGTQFLIDKLKDENYFIPNLENIKVSKETLSAFDVDHIDLVALLWQTGYLTFEKQIPQLDSVVYQMKVPNLEVQKSLNTLFFDYLTRLKSGTARKIDVIEALLNRDFNKFGLEMQSLFASIPYENYVKNNIGIYEGYYASVVYAFICSLGFQAFPEDTSCYGRADLTLIGPNEIVILEFKVNMPAEAAIHQIESKKYYEKYLNHSKDIFLMEMCFDSEKRNISSFEWKKYVQ